MLNKFHYQYLRETYASTDENARYLVHFDQIKHDQVHPFSKLITTSYFKFSNSSHL